jgi:hypothetical protein
VPLLSLRTVVENDAGRDSKVGDLTDTQGPQRAF